MTNKWEIIEDQIWYCETIQDLKNSPLTSKIIAVTSEKCWNIVDSEWESVWENIDSSIEEIFTDFISNNPLTPDEQQLILWFLDDPKALKMAQNIFSKLKIPQWNDNKFLFDIYLKDAKWDFDITNFIEYLKHYIENYSLIIRNDILNIEYQQTINETDYYIYKCADWTNSIFVITEWEIIYLDKPLSEIKVFNNWLIFWIEQKEPTINHEEEAKWVWYAFNWKEFIQIYNNPWLEWLKQLEWGIDWFNDLFLSQSKWKEWLIEISSYEEKSESEQDTKVNEILPAINNNVIVHRNWFITTKNDAPNKEWKEHFRYTTHFKIPDTYEWPRKFDTVKAINEIVSSDVEFRIDFFWDDYYMTVMEDGSNIYKFDKEVLRFVKIEWLQQIHTDKFMWHKSTDINKEKLLNWEPTEINYSNWNCQIAIFDKQTSNITSLILIKSTNYSTDIEEDKIEINVCNYTSIYYHDNWKLYWLKKQFEHWKIKEFFWKNIPLKDTYEEMQEYLEEIKNLPVDIN
jgi:hypothetical protein